MEPTATARSFPFFLKASILISLVVVGFHSHSVSRSFGGLSLQADRKNDSPGTAELVNKIEELQSQLGTYHEEVVALRRSLNEQQEYLRKIPAVLPPPTKVEDSPQIFHQLTPHQREYTREMPKTSPIYQNGTSLRWYPSEQWLHNCTKDLHPVALEEGEWKNPSPEMAIGDCIKYCRCYSGKHSPTSINGLYNALACKAGHHIDLGNLTIVDQIHQNQSLQEGFEVPDPNTLVVHLRLGDIVETSKSNTSQMLIEGGNPGFRARNFRKALKSAHDILDNLYDSGTQNVHIVGGSHKKKDYAKSRVYAGCLYRSVQAAGFYNAKMTIERSHPQQDFFYISHAEHLVVSAGGYSNLMGQLAERRGAKLWGKRFGVSW